MNSQSSAEAGRQANGSSSHENMDELKDKAKEKFSNVASVAAESARDYGSYFVKEPAKDVFELLRDYARSKPDVAAMWCFGIGVIVGWKLRP